MRYTKYWLSVALAVVSASAANAQNGVKIAALSDVTGPGAPNGILCRHGYEAAKLSSSSTPKGRPIEFLFGDHRGDPKTGVSEFTKFVQSDHVVAVIANRANVGFAMNGASKRLGVPLIGAIPHPLFTSDNPLAFRTSTMPTIEGRLLGEEAHKAGKRAAMLVLEEDYLLSVAGGFEKRFVELGGTIVSKEQFIEAEVDISPFLLRMQPKESDVIFLSGAVGQLGPFVRRLRERGFKQPIFSNFWIGYPEVIAAAGEGNVQGSTYVTVDYRRPKFLGSLRSVTDIEPTAVAYACYAAAMLVNQAVGAIETPEITSKQLAESLSRITTLRLPDESLPVVSREVQFQYVVRRIGEDF